MHMLALGVVHRQSNRGCLLLRNACILSTYYTSDNNALYVVAFCILTTIYSQLCVFRCVSCRQLLFVLAIRRAVKGACARSS